jgi:hypothetical protein
LHEDFNLGRRERVEKWNNLDPDEVGTRKLKKRWSSALL